MSTARAACVVLGTRPGIVMLAPVVRELVRRGVPAVLLHTSQHHAPAMDGRLLAELGLPPIDHRLAPPPATGHGAQTAAMLHGCEEVLRRERPGLVLVGGDANCNLAAALAARKLHIPVAHVEAGERSADWRMPEEHNRVLIDHLSELLLATSEKAARQLAADGVRGRVIVTGNPIVDAVHEHGAAARHGSAILDELGLAPAGYALVTLHREENVDAPRTLRSLVDGVLEAAAALALPAVLPLHPRTRRRLAELGLLAALEGSAELTVLEPQGHLAFLALLAQATVVLTDSGGVQQESCILGVPCVTLRHSTEWVETVEAGANRLAGADRAAIRSAALEAVAAPRGWADPFGPPGAARAIAEIVADALAAGPEALAPPRPSVPAPELTAGAVA